MVVAVSGVVMRVGVDGVADLLAAIRHHHAQYAQLVRGGARRKLGGPGELFDRALGEGPWTRPLRSLA